MDKEIKAKWVEALRSGKYQQGTRYLHNTVENTFCCLGVLCEITPELIRKKDGGLEGYGLPNSKAAKEYNIINFGVLTPELTVYFGLTSHSVEFLEEEGLGEQFSVTHKLMDMNDGYLHFEEDGIEIRKGRHTFAEIADWIEENL